MIGGKETWDLGAKHQESPPLPHEITTLSTGQSGWSVVRPDQYLWHVCVRISPNSDCFYPFNYFKAMYK